MDQVVAAGGPADWALPYWKWDATDGDGRIPVAFRNPQLPGGSANGSVNHLFVSERNVARGFNANAGERFATDNQMDKPFRCLEPDVFEGISRFGGPRVRRHAGQGPPEPPPALNGAGLLEGTPHGSIHVQTGGVRIQGQQERAGFMQNFVQAALDPIFWLHHCNIDRLWEVWIQRKPGFRNPDDKAWLDALDALGRSQPFPFHAADGSIANMTPRQVLNTRRAPLLYEYDDTTDPHAKDGR